MSGYTKIPNPILRRMKELSHAEFKVALAIYHMTLGNRKLEVRASYTKLSEATGVSRPYVMKCAQRLRELGLFKVIDDGGVTQWVVNSVNLTGKLSEPERPRWLTQLTSTGKPSLPPSDPREEKEETPPYSPPSYDGPRWTLPDSFDEKRFLPVWFDWVRHKIDKDKPLTQKQGEYLLADLEELGEGRAITAIKHSIAKGWENIYEPSHNGNGAKSEYAEEVDDDAGGFNL